MAQEIFMYKPKMFLLCGAPGSGKTTYAKFLQKKYGYKYFGIDDYYEKHKYDYYSRDDQIDIWLEFFKDIHEAEKEHLNIIVDVNAPNKYGRYDYHYWFSTYDITLYYIYADFDVCLRNNNKRDRKIDEKELMRMYKSFKAPNILEEGSWYKHIYFIKNTGDEFIPLRRGGNWF